MIDKNIEIFGCEQNRIVTNPICKNWKKNWEPLILQLNFTKKINKLERDKFSIVLLKKIEMFFSSS